MSDPRENSRQFENPVNRSRGSFHEYQHTQQNIQQQTNQDHYANRFDSRENFNRQNSKHELGQEQSNRNVQNLQQNDNVSRRIEDVVQPLSTQRLRPIRQQTKNAVANILSTGEVCLEFISKKRGKEKIQDVMRISGDGQRVVIYNLGRTQYSFQFDKVTLYYEGKLGKGVDFSLQ
jgi:hypothetical protein